MTVDDIVSALYQLRDPKAYGISGRKTAIHDRIVQLVRSLIRRREYPASQFIYECMVDAMASPQGSVAGIVALLKDMEKEKLVPNAYICQRALAALAVHPDYILRQRVLAIMRERWFTVDQTSQQHVALGLLRDGQYELAYEKLAALAEDHGSVDLWVYDIFIMVFGRAKFLDEMLQLFIDRKQAEQNDAAYLSLAYYVLDVCSTAFHYAGTSLIWTLTVRNGVLKPSDGMLENVLATASREGDYDVASQVISMMSDRGRVHEQHYDALVEAFATGNNLEGALRMVRIMARSTSHISRSHVRPVYSLLLKEPQLANEASDILRDLTKDDPVPWAVVGAVIEASAERQGSQAALDLYQDVELLTGRSDHHVNTIQTMIIHCAEDSLRARLIADYKERMAAGVDTSSTTRQPSAAHALITSFLDMDELRLAMHTAKDYARAHASQKELIPWLAPLAQKAVAAQDVGIWDLMDILRDAGHQNAADILIRAAQRGRQMSADQVEEAAV
jgi:hypothetical protein